MAHDGSTAQLSAADIRFLSTQLRGIHQARVRFLGSWPSFEVEVVELLMALGVSSVTEQMGQIAPYPKRKFGIRYKDQQAIITVAPDALLMG